MRKRIKIIFGHPLVSGSTIVFLGSLLGNIFNFLFNFVMTRYLLTPSEYGILASLTSLLTLSAQPVGAILPTLIYFSASYFAQGDLDKVRGLFLKVTKPSAIIGTMLFIFYIIFTPQIASFLNLTDNFLIFIIALMVYIGFIGAANMPLLQAKLSFRFISFSTVLGSLLKLIFGTALVLLGFSVGGALWGVFIGLFIPYILTFIPLRFLLHTNMVLPHISFKTLIGYGAPAALASFGLTSLINTDIILVKHFFTPESAGVYATLSLAGKAIFFFSAPIGMVMFPLITQRHAKGEDYHEVLRMSLLLVFLFSVAISIFYFLFPEFVIGVFSKNQATLSIAPYLGLFGIFITVYSLLTVLNNFYLSINKTVIYIPIIIAALLQLVFIWLYHGTVLEVIIVSLTITSLLLIGLLVYYWKLYGKKGI